LDFDVIAAEIPANESERLERLQRYRILDTPPEPAFDRITRIVAKILGVPMSLVTLIDEERQWFKSRFGLDASETPRELAFCAHAILGDELFIVEDATKDPRFFDNPLVVSAPFVRFYASTPLKTPDGWNLGTLCAIDSKPRTITGDQRALLEDLGHLVVDEMELRFNVEELEKARDEANVANMAKTDFLSSMSHELRTPLNAIVGFGQLLGLDDENPLSENQTQSVEQIIKAGGHLSGLVDHILALGQIEQGVFPLEIEDIDVDDVISDCVSLLEGQIQSKGLFLDTSEAKNANCPSLRTDRTRLKQVLLNILSNAMKYNTTGKAICLRTEIRDEGFLRIEILDDGPGIPLDKQVDLFKPFNRLGMELEDIEGSGIGLSISKSLMSAMEGDLGFESRPKGGSCFWLSIPLALN
jgi:signal transduction histidine kinase